MTDDLSGSAEQMPTIDITPAARKIFNEAVAMALVRAPMVNRFSILPGEHGYVFFALGSLNGFIGGEEEEPVPYAAVHAGVLIHRELLQDLADELAEGYGIRAAEGEDEDE